MSLSADDRFWTVREVEPPFRVIRCFTEMEAYKEAGKLSSDVQVIPPKSAAMEEHDHEWGEPSF